MSTKTLFRAIANNAAEEEFMIMAAHEYYCLSDSHSWRGIKPSRGLLRNKWPVEVHAEKGGCIEIKADLSEETIASTQSMQEFLESDLYQELRFMKHKTTKSLDEALERRAREHSGPRNLVEQLYKNTQEAVLDTEIPKPKDPRFCHCPRKGHYCECGLPEAPEGADEPGFNPKCEKCALPLYGTTITAKCQCSKNETHRLNLSENSLQPDVVFAQNLSMEVENQQTIGAWFKKKAKALMGVSEKIESGPEPDQKAKDIVEAVAKQSPITFHRPVGSMTSVPRRLMFLVSNDDIKKVMDQHPELLESVSSAVIKHGEKVAREYFRNVEKEIQKAIDRGDNEVTIRDRLNTSLPNDVTYDLSSFKKGASLETLEKRYMQIGKSETKARRFMDIARYFGHKFQYLGIQNIDYYVPDHVMSCKYICVKDGDILFTNEDDLISGLEEVRYSEVLCAINQARLDNADH